MRNKKVVIAASAIALMSNGGMILSPALSGIIRHFSDVPESMVSMLITIPALMMIPSSVLASQLSRRFPSKRIFLVCLSMLLVFGTLPVFVHEFPIVFMTRIFVGIAIGAMGPLATAMIANHFEGDERNRAMGVYTATEGFGGASMLLFCGWVVGYGWNLCFLVYVLAALQLAIVALCCPKTDSISDESEISFSSNERIMNPTLIRMMAIYFIYMSFLNVFAINNSLFIEEAGIGDNTLSGVVGALFQVSCFICGLLYSRVAGTFKKNTLGFGIGMSTVGMGVVFFAHSPLAVVLGSMSAGFGMGVTLATGNLINASSVTPALSAMAIAVGAIAYQLAQFMTPFIVHPIASAIFGDGVVRGRYGVSLVVLAALTVIVVMTAGVFQKSGSSGWEGDSVE